MLKSRRFLTFIALFVIVCVVYFVARSFTSVEPAEGKNFDAGAAALTEHRNSGDNQSASAAKKVGDTALSVRTSQGSFSDDLTHAQLTSEASNHEREVEIARAKPAETFIDDLFKNPAFPAGDLHQQLLAEGRDAKWADGEEGFLRSELGQLPSRLLRMPLSRLSS